MNRLTIPNAGFARIQTLLTQHSSNYDLRLSNSHVEIASEALGAPVCRNSSRWTEMKVNGSHFRGLLIGFPEKADEAEEKKKKHKTHHLFLNTQFGELDNKPGGFALRRIGSREPSRALVSGIIQLYYGAHETDGHYGQTYLCRETAQAVMVSQLENSRMLGVSIFQNYTALNEESLAYHYMCMHRLTHGAP